MADFSDTATAATSAEIATLTTSYRTDRATYYGTCKRGVYSGSGINSARRMLATLNTITPDPTAPQSQWDNRNRMIAALQAIAT